MASIQSVSSVDRQIVSTATEVLKATVGENIERVAKRVAKQLHGVDVADVVRVIDQQWAAITAGAGVGSFTFSKFGGSASDSRHVNLKGTVAGQQLPHAKTANEALGSRQMKAAGTLDARKHVKGDDVFVVQGPQYWDLMQHTKPFVRGKLERIIDQAVTFLHLGGLHEKLAYNLTKIHIDRVWSTGEKEKALRGISGTEIESLTQPGPNGEPAPLQPGDALLCGGGGDGGLTHCIVYAGLAPASHPDAGAPMIIHAMATLKEGATRAEWIADKVNILNGRLLSDVGLQERPDAMTGVLYERLGHFFNRYHRDSIMIVRDGTLSPEQIAKGIAHIRDLTGYDDATGEIDRGKRASYDYKLAPDDLMSTPQPGDGLGRREYLAKYCTEVWLAFDFAAHDGKREALPYVGTAHYNEGTPLGTIGVHETFISEPEDLAVSPDLTRVLVAGGGAYALAEAERLRVQAPVAFEPRATRPIPEAIGAEVRSAGQRSGAPGSTTLDCLQNRTRV